jgi:hypothetical protein
MRPSLVVHVPLDTKVTDDISWNPADSQLSMVSSYFRATHICTIIVAIRYSSSSSRITKLFNLHQINHDCSAMSILTFNMLHLRFSALVYPVSTDQLNRWVCGPCMHGHLEEAHVFWRRCIWNNICPEATLAPRDQLWELISWEGTYYDHR